MKKEELTTEQKIDYIYDVLKKQEDTKKIRTTIKYFIRFLILLLLIYLYFFGMEKILVGIKNIIVEEFTNRGNAIMQNVGNGYENIKENINSFFNF